ncbi:fatty acid/sphingolipid desaturase [Meredithblackwellia eburnea MCA 4105]
MPPTHPNQATLPLLSRATIASRIAAGELLVIHLPLVYRVPIAWLDIHPGRDLAILHYVGRDASNEIEAYHAGITVSERMSRWVVGRVEVGEDGWIDMVPPVQMGMWPPPVPKITVSQPDAVLAEERVRRLSLAPGKALTADLVDPPRGPVEDFPLTPSYQHHLRQSHRKLQQRLLTLGYDRPPQPLSGYGGVLCIYAALGALWAYLYIKAETSKDYFWAAVALGAFWHQVTFLGHDMGHTHITGNWWKDRFFGICIADFFGGLSLGWWCDNHNVHHLVTNSPEHDPDIQHLPFFAISTKFFNSLRSSYYNRILDFDAFAKFFLPYQHNLYYIIMCFARFNLLALSYGFLITKTPARSSPLYNFRLVEMFGCCFFWTWFGLLLKAIPGSGNRIMFLLVSFAVTSPLHVQIVLSHFSQSVSVTDEMVPHSELLESHPHRQLRTTMDIGCDPFLDPLHGGLNFQVEHHLFPRLPRFRLRQSAIEVEKWVLAEQELVKDGMWKGKPLKPNEGLVYKKMRFVEANRSVLGVLKAVGDQVALIGKVAKAEAKGELSHKH